MHKIKRYGHIRDSYDPRDKIYSVPAVFSLPLLVDLRPKCTPVYDQGELGSCTANALAGAIGFLGKVMTPSRLFIYYNERAIEHTVDSDSGAQIRDGIKSLVKQGVCDESLWPYDVAKFKIKPLSEDYSNALQKVITSYAKVQQDLNKMKYVLSQGFPFVFGFSVFQSFESPEVAKTGLVPMPTANDQPIGGHAVMCVGYDDSKECFIVRNSWGSGWAMSGYFYMPYDYMLDKNLVNDLWVIKDEE